MYISDGPRLLETHMLPKHLPEDFRQKSKFIVMLRNPKDTAVSMYHMLRKTRFVPSDFAWDEFFDIFFKGEGMNHIQFSCSIMASEEEQSEVCLFRRLVIIILLNTHVGP